MSQKIALLVLLCSLGVYASDESDKSIPLAKTVDNPDSSHNDRHPKIVTTSWTNLGCEFINPTTFNGNGKRQLKDYRDIWLRAANEGQVSRTGGLASIIESIDVEQVIKNKKVLRLANIYWGAYHHSNAARVEEMQRLNSTDAEQANYCYQGAEKEERDLIWIIRRREYHNIMWKRHEAIALPAEKLIACYLDRTDDNSCLQEILRLNTESGKLNATAIQALAIVTAYHLQCDSQSKKNN